METVVFPSPEAVGLIAVTRMSFPFLGRPSGNESFALYFPYSSSSSSVSDS